MVKGIKKLGDGDMTDTDCSMPALIGWSMADCSESLNIRGTTIGKASSPKTCSEHPAHLGRKDIVDREDYRGPHLTSLHLLPNNTTQPADVSPENY